MDKRCTNNEYLIKYARYLKGDKTVADFCRDEQIDYLEFVEFVNNWEDKHGEGMIESCMDNMNMNANFFGSGGIRPSRAQSMFQEIMAVPDRLECRSQNRFPENPGIIAELDMPKPETIVKQARITFPSGACVELQEAALKTLILIVVLYEDFDTWAGQ